MEQQMNNSNSETAITTSTPKKRGRKRKIDKLMESLNATTVSAENTISRSGRKRKHVNYYELANPDGIEDFTDIDFRSLKTPVNPTPEKRQYNKKPKLNKDSNVIDDKHGKISTTNSVNSDSDLTNSEVGDSLQANSCSAILIETDANLQETTSEEIVEPEKGRPVEEETENDENGKKGDAKSNKLSDSDVNGKEKRYNYTGETVKMMNTLFSIYKNKPDSSNEIEEISKPVRVRAKKNKKKEDAVNVANSNNADSVTCAVCNQIMYKTLWSHHKQRHHNNLAWRVGDPPLDLTNQSLVMRTLNMLYKKKKPLYCEKCGEIKKSVVGFLSHQSQCKKSEEQLESVKVACELCGKRMLPVSMMTHMKLAHTNPKKSDETTDSLLDNSDKHSLKSSKRSAATKALKIIEKVAKNDLADQWYTPNLCLRDQEFAMVLLKERLERCDDSRCIFDECDVTFKTLEDALQHIDNCVNKPAKAVICKLCLMVCEKKEEMDLHVEMTHGIQVVSKKNENDKSYSTNNSKLPHFLHNISLNGKSLFPNCFKWTYQFCKENYGDVLFEEFICKRTDWLLLPFNRVFDYLPKLSESCLTAQKMITTFINPLNQEYTFKKYELFECGHHKDGKMTIFCGGPISSMAWLPTPYNKDTANQILAVSILNTPDAKFLYHENYRVQTAIQFWNFGVLRNKEKSDFEPILKFSIAHDHGPVWHMEWCPSGCFNSKENLGRMGLLSVAGSDSIVYIYAVPHGFQDHEGLYFKPKPAIKLLLQRPNDPLLGGLKYYPRKISWTKGSQHNYIAVGYTNGLVGMFNLKTKSFVLRQTDSEGVTCILPYKIFQPHSHSVTALALHPLNGGGRWLLTSSLDRHTFLWDLENSAYPLNDVKKNSITDGSWFNNWIGYVTAADESSRAASTQTALKQSRDYINENSLNCLFSFSSILTLSVSDWLNGYIQGNVSGEITGIFLRQLFGIPDSLKYCKKKRLLLGYTYLIEKSKTPQERFDEYERKKIIYNEMVSKMPTNNKITVSETQGAEIFCDEPLLYEQAEEKYALLFCDNKMKSSLDFPDEQFSQLSASSKHYHVTQPNQYPLTQINQISLNPNRQASLYYATGYQAGFVRISWLSFLKDDPEIK